MCVFATKTGALLTRMSHATLKMERIRETIQVNTESRTGHAEEMMRPPDGCSVLACQPARSGFHFRLNPDTTTLTMPLSAQRFLRKRTLGRRARSTQQSRRRSASGFRALELLSVFA